jgi:uncharacterized membrane protein (DUF485 family)
MAAESQITAPAERALLRRVRRTALLLAAVAAAFYFGFIILTLVRSAK